MKPIEVEEFEDYVEAGYYSAWYKDNKEKIGSTATDEKSKIIRQWRVAQFPELEDCYIWTAHGTVDDVDINITEFLRKELKPLGTFIRIMVSNHDVYVEFIPYRTLVGLGDLVKSRIQYDEYKDKYGNKIYFQHAEVNYANYRIGCCYIAFKDMLRILNENSRRDS